MARIKIKDLPGDMKVSEDEMKKVRGGIIIVDGRLRSIYQNRGGIQSEFLGLTSRLMPILKKR